MPLSLTMQETWMVADGKLTPTGQKELKTGKDKEIAKFEVQEETTDAYGNVIKVCAHARALA